MASSGLFGWDSVTCEQKQERRLSTEEGSASTWFAALIAALFLLAGPVVLTSSIYAKRAWLQGVVDIAALAAADALPLGMPETLGTPEPSGYGCAVAKNVAEDNGTFLDQCWTEGFDVLLVIRAPISSGLPMSIGARARAGPAAVITDPGR